MIYYFLYVCIVTCVEFVRDTKFFVPKLLKLLKLDLKSLFGIDWPATIEYNLIKAWCLFGLIEERNITYTMKRGRGLVRCCIY